MTVDPALQALLDERAAARTAKDWARSDTLRDTLRAAGWVVRDTAEGQTLEPAPPYAVAARAEDLPDRRADASTHDLTVALVVDGWPEDVGPCTEAVLAHAPPGTRLLLLDNGGAGGPAVHAAALADARVEALHLAQPVGWSAARAALARACTGAHHAVMDVSTVWEGDAATPLLAALADPAVAVAGWRGVVVEDGWTSFAAAPAGEVEALLSYLLVTRRGLLDRVPFHPKARFYRNADLEWSFQVRAAGEGRCVAVDVPVRQDRHRGYHDSDPALRDKESRRTYDRFLQAFRGREDLRLR